MTKKLREREGEGDRGTKRLRAICSRERHRGRDEKRKTEEEIRGSTAGMKK